VYVSALNYNFDVNGNASESVTLVGNNKVWNNTFTATAFNNADSPLATHVQRRQNVKFGSSASLLPQDIPGVSASGTNEKTDGQNFDAHVESIKVSTNLGREQLFELGRR